MWTDRAALDPSATNGGAGPESAADRFWRFATVLVTLALVAHSVFLVLFLVLGLWFLSAVNVLSVCVYVVARALTRQQHYSAILLMITEFFVHALAAGWVLGWASGFQYYLLLGVPIHLMSERRAVQKFLVPAAITIGYLGLSLWLEGATPHAQVSAELQIVLRVANIAGFFGFLSYICLSYVQTVRQAETRLRVLAERDTLTGLFNRGSLLQFAEQAASGAPGRGTWLVFADIDHFKHVNDEFGHGRGDDTLRVVAEAISRVIRRADRAARWGGEEFLVLLPDADQLTALSVAERIRSAVSAEHPEAVAGCVAVTVTVGVAEQRTGETLDAALSRADAALYSGKTHGRDRVELAS